MPVYNEKNKKKWTKDKRHHYFKRYYTDMYGNRKQYQSGMYANEKIAAAEELKWILNHQNNDTIDLNISFENVLNEWLGVRKMNIRSSTYYALKKRVYKHILRYFKDFKLHSIKINPLMLWSNEIFNLNISLDSKNRIIKTMKEILKYAHENYDFNIKIANKLQTKKIEKTVKKKESTWNFWTYDEFQQFIKCVDKNSLDYLMFNFLYYTGLRFGEFMALTWEDIDFNKKTLNIDKQVNNRVEDDIYIITDPKTKNSIRKIGIDDTLLEMLKKHKEHEEKIYNFKETMFVFGNVKYIARTTFRRHLNRYIKLANVKKITPHGFRHSHVSLLIHLGCDSREVADRIGDTVSMVETTYYHMFPEKREHTIDVLNKLKS